MFSETFWETLFVRQWKQVRILLKWSFIIEDVGIWRERIGLISHFLYFRCFYLSHALSTRQDMRVWILGHAPLLNGKNYRKKSHRTLRFTEQHAASYKQTSVSGSRRPNWDCSRGRVETAAEDESNMKRYE
jgi:hypothetical protein